MSNTLSKNRTSKIWVIAFTVLLMGCASTEATPAPATAIPVLAGTEISTSLSTATPTLSSTTPGQPTVASPEPAAATPALSPESVFSGYTYQRADGNRWVAGRGALPNVEPLDIPLAGEPHWLVAAPNPAKTGSLWAVALADGRIQAFEIIEGNVAEITITPPQLPPGMPPLLQVDAEGPSLLTAPAETASPLSHPVWLKESGQMAFIDTEGNVIIWGGTEIARFEVNALSDARLLVDEQERLLLLTGATTRYGHGVVGDPVEAASITLIETRPSPRIALTIPIPDPTVVEGIAPIWADLSGDGRREIIVTLSNAQQGAQLVVFNEAGQQIAAGPAIGQGNRWRHQLAVAPFGPDGALELVDVLTPHLGRVTEFFRLTNDTLQLVAQSQEGYTSHFIGSRNLDMALAGDFDGDGQVELLLPSVEVTELGAIRRTATGAEVAWRVPLGGVLSTNLAATLSGGNGLAVGVGQTDGVLRVWLFSALGN